MSNITNVSIYMRHICLEVAIPKNHVWDFMNEFGTRFAKEHPYRIKAVEGYHSHPNGWHVKVKIWEHDEDKFYDFLRTFCIDRGLNLRDPKTNN